MNLRGEKYVIDLSTFSSNLRSVTGVWNILSIQDLTVICDVITIQDKLPTKYLSVKF